MKQPFALMDSIHGSRDWLRSLSKKSSVWSHINESRNAVIAITGIREDEKLDKCSSDLKRMFTLKYGS